MTASRFPLYVKSSIDKLAFDLGSSNDLPVVDLDSAALVAELLDSDQTAILWAMGNLSESPMDPLWYVDFDIGVKTSHDPAQYKSLDVTSMIASAFGVNTNIQIKDYSGDNPPTEVFGNLVITSIVASPSQPDRLSGIRLLSVQGRAIRKI